MLDLLLHFIRSLREMLVALPGKEGGGLTWLRRWWPYLAKKVVALPGKAGGLCSSSADQSYHCTAVVHFAFVMQLGIISHWIHNYRIVNMSGQKLPDVLVWHCMPV